MNAEASAEFDSEVGALYVTLTSAAIDRTCQLDIEGVMVNVDIDASGAAAGVEVLGPFINWRDAVLQASAVTSGNTNPTKTTWRWA